MRAWCPKRSLLTSASHSVPLPSLVRHATFTVQLYGLRAGNVIAFQSLRVATGSYGSIAMSSLAWCSLGKAFPASLQVVRFLFCFDGQPSLSFNG